MPVTRITDSQINSDVLSIPQRLSLVDVNVLKTNFKIDAYRKASMNRMDNLVIDVFSNQSGLNLNQTTALFDSTNNLIQHNPDDGENPSIVQSVAINTGAVPTKAILAAEFDGAVKFSLSRDGGSTWLESVEPGRSCDLSSMPPGTSLVLRAELPANAALKAWGLSWL